MRSDFVEYSWRNHMPSLGPIDLTITALTGIAMSVSVACGPSDDGSAGAARAAGQVMATAPIEADGPGGCGSLVTTPQPRSI